MRDWLIEPEKQVPVIADADVAVCGGGPAGICAAVAAARGGAEVLLVEHYGFVGGMATAGLVNPIYGFQYFDEKRQLIRGIAEEIVQELSKIEFGTLGHRRRAECTDCPSPLDCPTGGISSLLPFDPEAFKYVALKMLEESGAKLLLHAVIADVVVEEDKRSAVIIESKSGTRAIKAKILIDATGDGDVAASAGNPFEVGRGADGAVQPMSLVLKVGNVGREEARIPPDRVFPDPEIRARLPRMLLFRLPRGGEYIVNYDCGLHDASPLNAADLTRVQSKVLKDAGGIVEALRKHSPGCEKAVLLSTAAHVGVRESRRITGEYVLTEEDVLGARKFEDGVVRVAFPMDIHDPSGKAGEKNPMLGPRCGDYYEIPYRSLLPLKAENLLVAGRCISGTHEAHGSYRVMAPCMAMGQAAGTAAALCIRGGHAPRELNAEVLRSELARDGAF